MAKNDNKPPKSAKGSVEKQDSEKKSVEVSEKKSHAQDLEQNGDLINHPKFAKFKKGEV